MWIEELDNGKFKYFERYKDPITQKWKRVSITATKRNNRVEKQMARQLIQKIEDKINQAVEEEKKDTPDDVLFKDLAKDWLSYHKETVKKTTYNRSKSNINALNEDLGEIPLNQLTAADVNQFFLKHLKSDRFKYNTCKQQQSAVSRICDFGKDFFDYDLSEIKQGLKVPKINITPKNEFKYFEKEEYQQILAFFEKHKLIEFRNLGILLANTGMRFGELISVEEDAIDFQDGSIYVHRTYDKENKIFTAPKTGDERIAFFSKSVEPIIKEQIQLSKIIALQYNLPKENKLIFKTQFGNPTPMASFNKALKEVKIKGKEDATSHYFRHTFITMAVQNGMDKELIARQVGHSDTSMIDKVYKHFTKDMMTQQKEAMLGFKIA